MTKNQKSRGCNVQQNTREKTQSMARGIKQDNKARLAERRERNNRAAYNTLTLIQTLASAARAEMSKDKTVQNEKTIQKGLKTSKDIDAMKAMLHAMAKDGATDTEAYRKARKEGRFNEYFVEWSMKQYGGEDFGEAFNNFKKENKNFLDCIERIKNNIDPETGESDPSLFEISDEERYEMIIRKH